MSDRRIPIELSILRILNGKELHGYLIVKRLNLIDPTLFKTGEGTIYPILAKMEKDGLISSFWEEKRKVYQITTSGQAKLEQGTSEWFDYVSVFSKFFGGALHG